MQPSEQKLISERIDRGVALVRLSNTVGGIMAQSRDALADSRRVPGGPLPAATQALLEDLERIASAATAALGNDPDACY